MPRPAEPYSVVGRWFLATHLQDEAQRREYGQLVADDLMKDFIVVRLVFESLVRREFSLSNDPREINQFTTELLRTRRQLDQLQVAVVIRGALSDPSGSVPEL
jgi:transposase